MLFFPAVVEDGDPFREPAAEKAAGGLDAFVTRLAGRDRAVMGGGQRAGVVGDAEDEEAVVHEHGEERLAGELGAATPAAGGGEGAGDLAVDLHPVGSHRLVPETLHLP